MNKKPLPYENLTVKEFLAKLGKTGVLTTDVGVCGCFLCNQGWADVRLNNSVVRLNPGDVYIYTPSTFLQVLKTSDDLDGVIIRTTLEVIFPLTNRAMRPAELLMLREHPHFTLTDEQSLDIAFFTHLLTERILLYRNSAPDGAPTTILYQQVQNLSEAYFLEILYCYYYNVGRELHTTDKRSKIYQLFLISLMRHYKEQRSVSFYAEEQCLSVRYFSSLIREESGHSVSEWIAQMVIAYASQLILYSEKNIKEISLEFNFPNQSFFGKYFKQHTGYSPKEFRAKHFTKELENEMEDEK